MRPSSTPKEISLTVDDVKVRGQFIWPTTSTNWIEVQMMEPYRGSWLVRPCFHHKNPGVFVIECKFWAAKLKLELEYRKMRAINDHFENYPLRPPGNTCGYPEI